MSDKTSTLLTALSEFILDDDHSTDSCSAFLSANHNSENVNAGEESKLSATIPDLVPHYYYRKVYRNNI